MNAVMWVLTILLAVAFATSSITKLTTPKEKLVTRMPWVEDFSQGQIRGIATVEALGVLGLILPGATGIAPVLVPIAAVGLILVMVGAAITHMRRREPSAIVINGTLAALAAVVAWGRFGPWPL